MFFIIKLVNIIKKTKKKGCKNKHDIVIIKKLVRKEQKNIIEIAKKTCKKKHEINIENYLMKKKTEYVRNQYRNMPEEDRQKIKRKSKKLS